MLGITNALTATVKAVIAFWGMIKSSLVVLQMLHMIMLH
jgi:hypothetical protein